MHAKYEEDPITLAVMVNHLCRSFGRITKVRINNILDCKLKSKQ